MKKFNELQKIISLQDQRIFRLEKQPVGPDIKTVVELQKTVQLQKARITELEARVLQLEALKTDEEHKSNTSLEREMLLEPNETNTNLKANFVRKDNFYI